MVSPRKMKEALADALARLKTAERTAAELRAALVPKHGEEATEAAIATLAARRLLSEDRAAEATVRPRASGRRAEGDQKLRERLQRRGATDDAVEKALAELPDEARRMRDASPRGSGPTTTSAPRQAASSSRAASTRTPSAAPLDRFFGSPD